MVFAAGFVRADETLAGQHDAVGHHFALRDGGAESPGGADQHHGAVGGLAQAAAGGARGNERLHQHRHRGVGRMEIVLSHRTARIRGPERRPAGAQRGKEFGVLSHAEEAFKLSGET